MDTSEAIEGRRSVRAFKNRRVSREIIDKLIDEARWAPSAGNVQPWEFVVVRDEEVKTQLANAASDQAFIKEAPVFIVVCADENRSVREYGSRGKELSCIQDTAAAVQNMLLTAYSIGQGTC
jgi:nitroreductase